MIKFAIDHSISHLVVILTEFSQSEKFQMSLRHQTFASYDQDVSNQSVSDKVRMFKIPRQQIPSKPFPHSLET